MIDVLLADDQALVRAGLRALIDAAEDLTVVGEAANGAEAVELVRRHLPAVVLMDIRMPTMDGIEATRVIASDADLAGVRVVVLTTFETDQYVFDALAAGASGFLLKDSETSRLLEAIRVVHDGEALLAPSVTRRLIGRFASRPTAAAGDIEELTPREREVTALVADGLSNDEIADELVISPATAKTHVSRAMRKLGARDRAQMVVMCYQSGLSGGDNDSC